MTKVSSLYFNFHGVSVEVDVKDPELTTWLVFDFGLLEAEPVRQANVRLTAQLAEPPWSRIPPVPSSMHSPNYVCYDSGDERYVDYFGRALAIHNRPEESVELFGKDKNFLYEKLYLIILSRVGEILDRQGIHRVHALGLAAGHGAVLVLLPMHGGKSTLALSFVAESGVRLLSDDTPLITRAGRVLSFPVRMGVRTGDEPSELSAEFMRPFERENREPKTLISLEAFRDKVVTDSSTRPSVLIVGQWTAASEPSIVKIGRFSAVRALVRDCVFGLGLPQVVEFFLQSTARDTLGKIYIAWSRLYASVVLVIRSKCYRIYLSRDRDANRKLLLKLLKDSESLS